MGNGDPRFVSLPQGRLVCLAILQNLQSSLTAHRDDSFRCWFGKRERKSFCIGSGIIRWLLTGSIFWCLILRCLQMTRRLPIKKQIFVSQSFQSTLDFHFVSMHTKVIQKVALWLCQCHSPTFHLSPQSLSRLAKRNK